MAVRLRRAAAVLLALALSVGLAGCGRPALQGSDLVLGTWVSVRLSGTQQDLDDTLALLRGCEEQLDPEQGDISRINAGAGQPVSVSADTAALIRRALSLSEQTGGSFDITVGPLMAAWGLLPGAWQQAAAMPSAAALSRARAAVGWKKVTVDGDRVCVPEGGVLDLGGIAQGWAADRAAALLRQRGVTDAMVDMGGSVVLLGDRGGRGWVVGVVNPLGGEPAASLALTEAAIATAGAYERYVLIDGKPYGHIIDPRTGRPADSGVLSVTAVGTDAALCDALATAAFVLGPEEGLRLLEDWPDVDGLLLLDDGTAAATAGLRDRVTLRSSDFVWRAD